MTRYDADRNPLDCSPEVFLKFKSQDMCFVSIRPNPLFADKSEHDPNDDQSLLLKFELVLAGAAVILLSIFGLSST